MLDTLEVEPEAIYIFDRGYFDFKRLYKINLAKAYFIIRAKKKFRFIRLKSMPVDKTTGVRSDQIIKSVSSKYPAKLRRVTFYDKEKKRRFAFLTNNFLISAEDVAALYKKRWQVELFFKWIKQNLKIKHFYGNSDNAVRIQIWVAISIYVQILILKKQLKIKLSPTSILQIASTLIWEKIPIKQAFIENQEKFEEIPIYKQLKLFDFPTGQ